MSKKIKKTIDEGKVYDFFTNRKIGKALYIGRIYHPGFFGAYHTIIRRGLDGKICCFCFDKYVLRNNERVYIPKNSFFEVKFTEREERHFNWLLEKQGI
ncbi:MAG: hypothetical protein KatS3mg001_018 [Candidatus Pacearchaeota archaeon]|nr:MAG: hypothetical protein KatS3mg001_018 [Candidatus Pacearchaeota archaeon]